VSRVSPGRWLALLGILLVALNVRTAVSSLSPIVDRVSLDVPLDELGLGLIGMLPPVAFAISAIAAPVVARRIGIELSMALACVVMVAGPLLRAFAGSYGLLVAGSALTLAGMGFANVLLPPSVKKYFPDRIGVLTAAYVTLLAISTTIAAALAEPVAATAGWRVSLGMWAALALVALVPWVVLLLGRRSVPGDQAAIPEVHLSAPVWRSGVARSLAVLLMVSAFSTYAMFAWLPTLLAEHAGTSATDGGNLLALYSIVGLPLGLVVPIIAGRTANVSWVIYLGVASIVAFGLGLLLAPTAVTWLWAAFGGLGGVLFPLCLVLINLRTRSTSGSIAVSGFAQAIGYAGGALGPLVLAVTHDLTGAWTVPLIIITAMGLVGLIPAITLAKPRFVEDQLA
jgi:CP family cyanate transporter-like MFS transporter